MGLYTQLDDNSIQQIVQQYEIGPIKKWSILNGGLENTNHLIETTQNKYVLTLCERKTFAESNNLVQILKHLENQGFKTSKVVVNSLGKQLSIFQNKPVILKEFIEGKVVNILNENLLSKLGRSLAQLNQITPPLGLPNQFSYGQQFFKDIYQRPTPNPFYDWLEEKHQFILNNLSEDLPKAFIHGDVFASNVVIATSNTPIIMDFEEACYYYRIFDLGMAITGLCRENGLLKWEKVQALISGYQQEFDLLSIEKERINAFIIYAATATAYWRYKQFNILFPTDNMKNYYKEMQEIADQVHSKLKYS